MLFKTLRTVTKNHQSIEDDSKTVLTRHLFLFCNAIPAKNEHTIIVCNKNTFPFFCRFSLYLKKITVSSTVQELIGFVLFDETSQAR